MDEYESLNHTQWECLSHGVTEFSGVPAYTHLQYRCGW